VEVQNTIAAPFIQKKNKHINNIFLFIVRLLLVMIDIVLVINFEELKKRKSILGRSRNGAKRMRLFS